MTRRILLLLTDLKIGGTPTVVREIAVRLHRPPQVVVAVACLDRWGPVADQLKERGFPVTALNAAGVYDVTAIWRLVKLIRGKGHSQHAAGGLSCFDTVLSFLLHANAAAAAVSPFCPGVRFLQSIQTTQAQPRWHWKVQQLAQHAAEKIVVPSPSVADVAQKWAGVPAEKIVIIPNGVDLPSSPPIMRQPSHPHRIVFIGRLDPVKRLPDLLEAIALLQGYARLDIYGEGAERAVLGAKIRNANLGSLVTLHGTIATPAQALAGAELLVLPSEAEGFGLVLIEAMAAGVPVVATNAPGIRDVVRDGVTGILVPVGSPTELAAAIRSVLDDQLRRQSLIAAAYADVRRRFTWDAATGEYRQLFRL